MGSRGAPNHSCVWLSPIVERFRDPDRISRETSVAPLETSYEILWAAERRPPRNAYFELLDQPALITEWTEREEIAKRYSLPSRKSTSLLPSPSGTTAHPALARPNVTTGARRKSRRLALLGTIDSLIKSLRPSASG